MLTGSCGLPVPALFLTHRLSVNAALGVYSFLLGITSAVDCENVSEQILLVVYEGLHEDR